MKNLFIAILLWFIPISHAFADESVLGGKCSPEICQFKADCYMEESDTKIIAPFIRGGYKMIAAVQVGNYCIFTLVRQP